MNTIIITKIKNKTEKQKIENLTKNYALKQINNTTYIGNINQTEKEEITDITQTIIKKEDTILIIPTCQKCKQKIQTIGKQITLKQKEYIIL